MVLTNGCFDVVHGGHISYLMGARAHGDVLVVGLNSDASVRRNKGEGRPICNETERLAFLSVVRGVDYVIVFDEPTVERLLRTLRPDVHAKGTDYTEDTVPEREVTRALGARTAIVGDPKDHSSTDLLRAVADFLGRSR